MKLPKPRSGTAVAAQMRRGGPMRDKRERRAQENKNPDFLKEHETSQRESFVSSDLVVAVNKTTILHAVEILQIRAEQWTACSDAWKTLNELREALGMKILVPMDFPKWPDYFDK